ncbi:MAG: GH92 family glycosyl hydrolase [Bacteroidota bacterium]|nr:GH92 family glycosyl hydrolase [Bacteroidota bacterium]
MKSIKLFLLFSVFLWTMNACTEYVETENNLVEWVNPLMGTQSKHSFSNGNVYPAIAVPWGMNFWTPQTGRMGNGWIYSYEADKINGFKQTHQPSPWIGDYGQFAIMPVTGEPTYNERERASWFSHKSEVSKPHYYSVYLADHDVVTEITPTERAAMFRFTFPENDSSFVVIDALNDSSYVKVIPEEKKVIGYSTKNRGGVPENFKNYFVVIFDKPFTYSAVFNEQGLDATQSEVNSEHTGAVIGFKTKRGDKIHASVASSFISHEQAEINLRELNGDGFDEVKEKAKAAWNEVLSAITVEGGTDDQMRTFYSCLYRSLLFPRRLHEIDAQGNVIHYSPYNGQVLPGYMFTDTGFWDTFRSLFPLLNLVYPSMNAQMQEGLVNTYLESGFLPEWASPGHRDCMVGNNSASVVADAYLKGVDQHDIETIWEAVVHGTQNVLPQSRSTGRLGHEYYNSMGYIPYNVGINENAARTLEYAYNDWCIYRLAKKLNRPDSEVDLYAQRSQNYRNLFDKETGLMRGRNEDGTFQTPFNPFKWGDAFTEGNSWHYTWSVFHDVQGLIDLMGGQETFNSMLDSVFILPPIFDESYYGGVIHEIREMQVMNMGNYAHGNQPIQHMIYLYNYSGEPWKAQSRLREVMTRFYWPTPDGYCGDEDNGQTSAWYVFSALGFYPVCPASDEYVMGAPLFKKAIIRLENGNKVVINAPGNSLENCYIESMRFNGASYTRNFLKHDELMKGAVIDVKMSDKPNKKRGIEKEDFPYSFSTEGK